jgi:hypothetical protein
LPTNILGAIFSPDRSGVVGCARAVCTGAAAQGQWSGDHGENETSVVNPKFVISRIAFPVLRAGSVAHAL